MAPQPNQTFRQAPWLTLPNLTGGTTALKLRVHLNPSKCPRATPVIYILSPSLGARIGIFGSAAATKCASLRGDGPRHFRLKKNARLEKRHRRGGLTHFVAAALPNIPIRPPKLGDRISLTGVARGCLEGLRCTRSYIAVVPPVRFGRVSQGGCLKVFFGCGAIAAETRALYGGGAPKSPCARPQARR